MPVFKFTFEDGYTIKSTLNHQYLTNTGWGTMAEILNIDSLSTTAPKYIPQNVLFHSNGKTLYKDKEYVKSLRERGFSVQQMADDLGISYHTVRKWLKIHDLKFSKDENCFKKGQKPWNTGKKYKLTKQRVLTEEQKLKRSKMVSGSNSRWWKGGITPEIKKLRRECSGKLAKQVFERDGYVCECGSKNKLNAHHIIPVYADPSKMMDIDNMITLCNDCHKYIHSNHLEREYAEKKGRFFTKKKPMPPKKPKMSSKLVKLTSIEYVGEEDVYDLAVQGPYHNFVCNGMIVHNSASGQSARYRTMPNEFLAMPDDVSNILSKVTYPYDKNLGKIIIQEYNDICQQANDSYIAAVAYLKEAEKNELITNAELKRAREFLRGQLPQHNMVERVSVMNLRSFANFQKLRNSEHAQPEIRYVAEQMLEQVKQANVAPVCIKWLEQNGWSL